MAGQCIVVFCTILAQLLGSRGMVSAGTVRFVVTPEHQTVLEGDNAILTCTSSMGTNGWQYSWQHDGRSLSNSTRIYQIGSDLHIAEVQHETDVGEYICIATSSASGARQASPPARLNVIWLHSASIEMASNTANQVVLKCHIKGSAADGLFAIEWYRNSEKLSTLKNIKLQENELLIERPSGADNGLYRCTVSNAAGRVISNEGVLYKWRDPKGKRNLGGADCMARLGRTNKLGETINQVFLCRGKRGGAGGSLPEGDSLPTDVNIIEGPAGRMTVKENDPIELPCLYRLPDKYQQLSNSVQLRWRKDGKVIRYIDLSRTVTTTAEPNKELLLREDARVTVNRQSGSLIFNNVIAGDAGQYMCQIYIDGYDAISSDIGELDVIEQLKFVPQPTSKNLELGSLGKVHCKAQGTPTPQVRWLKESDLPLPDSIEDINGTLLFKNVGNQHRGNYTCIASSSQGQIRATVSVNVVVAPRFSVAPEGPIETAENSVAVMHCQAIGDPKPTIQWDKDLQYLSENNTDRSRFRFLKNGTLEIHSVQLEDDGRYGCTIGNSAGLKREEVRFIVKAASNISEDDGQEGFLITRAVLITMSVAFAYIILVVGLMIWCRYRRQARKAQLDDNNRDNVESLEAGKNAENEPCLAQDKRANAKKMNGNNNPKSNGHDSQKSDDTAGSSQSKGSKKSHAFDQLSLPRTAISEIMQIGRGEFGDVFVGKIKTSIIRQVDEKEAEMEKLANTENGIIASSTVEKRRSKTSMDDIEEIKEEQETAGTEGDATASTEYKLVLIKALNKIKDESACQEFKRQIELFRAVSHKGVVRLYGLCREKDPHYMILENTDWGDLKQFLLATAGKINTSTNSSSPPPLKTGQILAVAYQIARGMDAIYRARFIHKDLAARNCIISSDFIVKVSYPALCKDKYSREYFKHRNSLLPIRWLAPECILEDEYTTKSDVFAFGVVVWELFLQATKIPFEELSNEDVIQQSQTGQLQWACADTTPECLQEILTSCWRSNPKERPSFSQLCSALSKAMQRNDK